MRDCLGVALAGSKEEDAKICAEIARQEGAKEEATVIGQGFRSSALQAAFANGTAAHAMDFDHSFTLMGQPTAPIIPAIFALGESLGASGRQILEAYTTGFEVTGKTRLLAARQQAWRLACPEHFGIFWRCGRVREAPRTQCFSNRDGVRDRGLHGQRDRG